MNIICFLWGMLFNVILLKKTQKKTGASFPIVFWGPQKGAQKLPHFGPPVLDDGPWGPKLAPTLDRGSVAARRADEQGRRRTEVVARGWWLSWLGVFSPVVWCESVLLCVVFVGWWRFPTPKRKRLWKKTASKAVFTGFFSSKWIS